MPEERIPGPRVKILDRRTGAYAQAPHGISNTARMKAKENRQIHTML
jgi:hypothetical protein